MEFQDYIRFIFALVFVLALIGLFAWLAKRFGFSGHAPRRVAKGRRLSLIEVTPLDPRRRLVLLRRDDVEHLVLLGATSETVIETNIRHETGQTAPAQSPAQSPAQPEAGNECG
jgi:flagellar protein FliO/FliZ